ncbi:MAG: amidohydrolase family protein, partial [Verrucomicrobiae bacterium]|nr:amidohydrolase family protein [Verrucomicrobiae bacterium]
MGAEPLLLTGATVHTVSGETLAPGFVLIEGRTIKAVGRGSDAGAAAAGARRIELNGLHLYPGMIALNTRLGLTEIGAVRATHDHTEVGEGFNPDVRSWLAVNPDSELLPVARANGISHFQPVPHGGVVSGLSGLMALDGWTIEEMRVKAPVALHVFWPVMQLDTTPRERAPDPKKWKSLEDQDRERREKIRALNEFFAEARAYATAREAATGLSGFPPTPAWEAMLPVLRREIPVIVHAEEVRQIRAAVEWARTNGLRMILAEGRDAWRVAELLASNRVPVIYNNVFTQPQRDTDAYDVQFRAPEVLRRAGVTVAFGLTGWRDSLVKNLPYEAAQAVAFGYPADEALKGLTLYPARLLGVEDRLGSIEPGKEATLFACDGDILDVRANLRRMWIAGREVSLE